MTGLRVALDTLGCRMNQFETAAMEESLRAKGYRVVSFEDLADVYVINTCTVTGKSDYRSRQLARRAVKRNEEALVVLAGCYPQASQREAARLEGVDLILGNQEKLHLAERLDAFVGTNGFWEASARRTGGRGGRHSEDEKLHFPSSADIRGAHPGLFENSGRVQFPLFLLRHHSGQGP